MCLFVVYYEYIGSVTVVECAVIDSIYTATHCNTLQRPVAQHMYEITFVT